LSEVLVASGKSALTRADVPERHPIVGVVLHPFAMKGAG
jgi:hypothetical protein